MLEEQIQEVREAHNLISKSKESEDKDQLYKQAQELYNQAYEQIVKSEYKNLRDVVLRGKLILDHIIQYQDFLKTGKGAPAYLQSTIIEYYIEYRSLSGTHNIDFDDPFKECIKYLFEETSEKTDVVSTQQTADHLSPTGKIHIGMEEVLKNMEADIMYRITQPGEGIDELGKTYEECLKIKQLMSRAYTRITAMLKKEG